MMARRKEADMGVMGVRHVVQRMVPDPSMSDAEFHHQRQVKPGPNVGKVEAQVNLVELIGGLARIPDREPVQEEAAARYRKLWDRAQIGGARAIDYAQARVDTSGPSEAAVWEIGEDARREFAAVQRTLGMVRCNLLDRVIVHDESLRSIAGKGGRAVGAKREELMAALDELAVHFRLGPSKVT